MSKKFLTVVCCIKKSIYRNKNWISGKKAGFWLFHLINDDQNYYFYVKALFTYCNHCDPKCQADTMTCHLARRVCECSIICFSFFVLLLHHYLPYNEKDTMAPEASFRSPLVSLTSTKAAFSECVLHLQEHRKSWIILLWLFLLLLGWMLLWCETMTTNSPYVDVTLQRLEVRL